MAKHRPRFFIKDLIGMGAVTLLAATMPTPARAETIDLICSYSGIDYVVSVDTERQSVVGTVQDTRHGPFAALISDKFIRWTEPTNDWETKFTIDRVTGTIWFVQFRRGKQHMDGSGRCRRATQKF